MDPTTEVLLKVVPAAATFAATLGGFTLWKQRREHVLKTKQTIIQEAWSSISDFRQQTRHWVDSVVSSEKFFEESKSAFDGMLKAFQRAKLVLDPATVTVMDRVFDEFASMRVHHENAAMYQASERAAPGAYGNDIHRQREGMQQAADRLDFTVESIQFAFERHLHGWIIARWRAKQRALIQAQRPQRESEIQRKQAAAQAARESAPNPLRFRTRLRIFLTS